MKKSYFQAVSNSSWANKGYLVALDINTNLYSELERLNKEVKKLQGEIERIDKKLGNQGFVAKAPEAVIDAEKGKREKYVEMLEAVKSRVEALNS